MKPAAMRLSLALTLCVAAYSQTPVVSSGGVANAANFSTTVAPGSYVSIFGSGLANSTVSWDSVPLSNSLNNVSVTFNGVTAPLKFVSTGQINAQLPWNVLSSGTVGTATVIVTNSGKASTPQTVQVVPFSPGIFAIGTNAVAINADGSIAAPEGSIPPYPTHPAKIGDPGLQIWCTGLGAVDFPVANGADSLDKLRTVTTKPTVLVGNQPVQVDFAGLQPQFPGINQINITLPAGTPTGNAVPVQISVGGVMTSASITMAISK